MRIAVGGIVHETNTYAVDSFGLTTLDSFDVHRGDEMLRHRGARTFTGGMFDAIDDLGFEAVPTLHAWAQPSGTIEAATYNGLKAELLDRLSAALPVDAVVLDTHGAGIVEGIDDLEADLGAAVRAAIGNDCPLLTTLDLHGSITAEMARVFDLMVGVYDYPHVDMYERGVEAIKAVPELRAGRLQPTTHVEPLPMLLPTSTTDVSPAKDIRALCLETAQRAGVQRCTFFHGFPFTDIPAAGASVVVTTHDDLALAKQVAEEIAEQIWDRREQFRLESVPPEIAIRHAIQLAEEVDGPVVVNDTADNPGGGAPGDATHVLRALIASDADAACFGYIFDPSVADQAHQAGTGATIDVKLGGKHDDVHGAPLEVSVYVKVLSDGGFVHTSPMLAGLHRTYGKMARLQVGGRGGIDVLVGSVRSQVFDDQVFALHGIDVRDYKIVALKSSQHFRAGFADLAGAIVTADSPGLTTLRVENFAHPRVDGPRWPIDRDARWARSDQTS